MLFPFLATDGEGSSVQPSFGVIYLHHEALGRFHGLICISRVVFA